MCREEDCPESQPIGVVVKRACFCVGIFFALMLLLNGEAMYTSATRLEYGKTRDFWVAVLRPVGRVSKASGFSYLRHVTETTFGEWLNRPSEK